MNRLHVLLGSLILGATTLAQAGGDVTTAAAGAAAISAPTPVVPSTAPNGATLANPGTCLTADSAGNHDGSRDYDFISGRSWTLKGRKRVGRFIGSDKWEEMEGFENSRRVGDMGMIEEVTFPKWRPDYKLVILRLYDPQTKRWSIYDAHDPKSISPPLHGTFHRGLGVFVGDDVIDGKPVKVRYIWTCDWTNPRFQQEFSADGGKSWEIDWQMVFTEAKK